MDNDAKKRVLVLQEAVSSDMTLSTVHEYARKMEKEHGGNHTVLLMSRKAGADTCYVHIPDSQLADWMEIYSSWSGRFRSGENCARPGTFFIKRPIKDVLEFVEQKLEEIEVSYQ